MSQRVVTAAPRTKLLAGAVRSRGFSTCVTSMVRWRRLPEHARKHDAVRRMPGQAPERGHVRYEAHFADGR